MDLDIEAIGGEIKGPINHCQQIKESLQHQRVEDETIVVTPISHDRQHSVEPSHKDNDDNKDDEDEDERPLGRRKRRSIEFDDATETTTRKKAHRCSPTIAQAQTCTTRSSPVDAESNQSADYQEYPFQGIYKRVRIGRETTYNLQFSLQDLSDSFRPSIDLQISNSASNEESVEASAYLGVCASHANKSRPVVQKQRKRLPLRERVVSRPGRRSTYSTDDDELLEKTWEVEALLAKSKVGNVVWYLVKWKGFPDDDNTWQKRDDISSDLIKDFETSYQGNHSGVQLLKKRERRGKIDYFVQWKGRLEAENSWEKEATISRERIKEFEAR